MGVLGVSIIMGLYYWFARLRFGYIFRHAVSAIRRSVGGWFSNRKT